MVNMEIFEVFETAEKITVYNQGNAAQYTAGSKPYSEILQCWYSMTEVAHDMPAYGVSLNRETVKALKSGLWVEFDFGKRLEVNGLPFEKLLIGVEREFYGFNLVRYNAENGYDGRCFYFDLNGKNMSDLYNLLLNF